MVYLVVQAVTVEAYLLQDSMQLQNIMWGQQGSNYNQYGGQYSTQGQGNFIPQPNVSYKILCAASSNFCIDASAGGMFSQNDLILYPYHGGDNQKFRFVPAGNDSYQILCVANHGSFFSPNFEDQSPGKQCYVDTANSVKQTWMIVPKQGGFSIVLSGKGFCLDVKGEHYAQKTPVVTWFNEGKPNQSWLIVPA